MGWLSTAAMGAAALVMKDGRVLANEMAPRPHNSGHWTIDACATSQFEQLVRAICGLPLGPVDVIAPSRMENLIGDEANDWLKYLGDPTARLHLYGKPGCQLCRAAKDKLSALKDAGEIYGYAVDSITEFTELHEGWREDGSVEVAAGHAMGMIPAALMVLQRVRSPVQVVGTFQPFLANISVLYRGLLYKD